ncbi:PEP-CTERM system TPR-repeat protein PrsT [Psychrosphaera sp. B3R10]|nr:MULTISPECIES: XrtA/PEP-CTERM system TPR-repeat protein PrsT [unclassified Psychrosphaera]MBU2882715.1 PEP-CTERM system TPR-repeat protein PrsT [Psychrosphaera sp. I2R16]MBU2989266.1 PEP-CTERM system TPR-repeat protein PrsT [Psychrosphaera sp. B3R10]MDO6718100.1 PEP-CTERM system TPR-repeat protein PrsT [Psychrosphaera sp. 1_MG-2023]
MFHRALISASISFLLLFSFAAKAANSYYEQAVQAFYEEKYESSFIYLKNALDAQPDNLPAKILMGKIFLRRGYFNEAIKQFEESLAYKADINLILSDYATALNFAKRYKEVLVFADGYKLNDSSAYELYINKAIAYQNLDLTVLSRKSYQNAIALNAKDTRALNSLASLESSLGNIEEAQKLISRSLIINPNDHRTYHLQGQIRMSKNDYQGAIESYNKALNYVNNDPVVQRSIISAFIKVGRIDDAEKMINDILAVTPEDPHIMLLSSWMMSIRKQDEQSASMLESLSNTTSMIPEDEFINKPSLIFVTALSSYLQGNIEQASKELSKYLNLAPGDLRAISMLTNVYLKQDKSREATYLLERHESAVISDLKLAIRLVDLYLSNGQKFEAEMLLEKLELEYPNELDVTLRLVSIYNQSGRSGQARLLIERVKNDKSDIRLDIARGLMFLQNGDIPQAYDVVEKLSEQFPDNFDLQNFKSAVLIKQNKAAEAQKIIVKLLETRPDFFEARFNLATTHKMLGRFDVAKNILEELHAERSTHADVKYMLAQIYAEYKNFDQAIPLLVTVQAKKTGRLSQELLYDIYFEQKEYQSAYKVIKELSASYMFNPPYLFKQVAVLDKLGKKDEAAKQLGILYGLAEGKPKMIYDVAVLQRQVGDFEGAGKSIAKLKSLIPNNLRVNIESIRLELDKQEIQQAQLAAEKLYKEVKNEPNVLLLLGDIASTRRDTPKAFDYYWQAIEINPEFNLALLNLYQIAKENYKAAEFETLVKASIPTYPKQVWRIRLLADHYMNLNKFQSAKPLYQKLMDLGHYKDDAFLLNNMAMINMDSSLETAMEFARKAFDLNDSNASIKDTLGWGFYHQARYDAALEMLRSAHAMDSNNATIRYHLAQVLIKLERTAEAKRELDAALSNGEKEIWFAQAKQIRSQL